MVSFYLQYFTHLHNKYLEKRWLKGEISPKFHIIRKIIFLNRKYCSKKLDYFFLERFFPKIKSIKICYNFPQTFFSNKQIPSRIFQQKATFDTEKAAIPCHISTTRANCTFE